MAKFFIDRPIFAWVISIFIIAAGIFGIKSLPVSQYPSVAAPTITLHAIYPGASAQVMEGSVLSVIERNMNGVEGLDYMSTSADSSGSGSVSLTFTPDTDENLAQVEVQNKLSEVLSTLFNRPAIRRNRIQGAFQFPDDCDAFVGCAVNRRDERLRAAQRRSRIAAYRRRGAGPPVRRATRDADLGRS